MGQAETKPNKPEKDNLTPQPTASAKSTSHSSSSTSQKHLDKTPSAVFRRQQKKEQDSHEHLIKTLQEDTHFDKVETQKLYEVFMSLSKGKKLKHQIYIN